MDPMCGTNQSAYSDENLSDPADRRKAVRRMYKSQAICHRDHAGEDESMAGQLLNVSATGAQILVRGEFAHNETLVVTLVNARRQTVAEMNGTIRWLKPEGPGVCRMGVLFETALTDDQLGEIV